MLVILLFGAVGFLVHGATGLAAGVVLAIVILIVGSLLGP